MDINLILVPGKSYQLEFKYNLLGAKLPEIEIQRVLNSISSKIAGTDPLPYYITEINYVGLQYIRIYFNPNLYDKTGLDWGKIFISIMTTGKEKLFDKLVFTSVEEKQFINLSLSETALSAADKSKLYIFFILLIIAGIVSMVYAPEIKIAAKSIKKMVNR